MWVGLAGLQRVPKGSKVHLWKQRQHSRICFARTQHTGTQIQPCASEGVHPSMETALICKCTQTVCMIKRAMFIKTFIQCGGHAYAHIQLWCTQIKHIYATGRHVRACTMHRVLLMCGFTVFGRPEITFTNRELFYPSDTPEGLMSFLCCFFLH